jgi:phospholipid transport system substrate-binding protein
MRKSDGIRGIRLSRRYSIGMTLAAVVGVASARAQGGDPRQGVSELYVGLQTVMRMGPAAPFQQRFDRIAPVIDRVFDLDTILQSSIGLRWSSLDEAARQSIFAVFRTFTIATYVENFDKDGGLKFDVLPGLRASGTDEIVQSTLTPPNGELVRIDYVMRAGPPAQGEKQPEPREWRVVDVLLDGSISRVAVQRSDFRALLTSGEPGPLIDSLKKKIVDLSGGAMRP